MVNYYTYIEFFLQDIHKQISLNEFEKQYNKPHQTIKVHLNTLINSKILIQDKRKRFLFYKLNLDNPLTYEYITICEKQRLIQFLNKELFHQLYLMLHPCFVDSKILIFGSATTSREYSDIDMLILTENNKIREKLREFELTYSVKIHPIITTEKNLTKTFIKELQMKHIIFNEHEYYVNRLYKS